MPTYEEEEEVESFESLDLDVLVQQRSSEFEHPERDEAEVPEGGFVRLLADTEKDLPRDVCKKRGGPKRSLEGGREGGGQGRKSEGELGRLVSFLFCQPKLITNKKKAHCKHSTRNFDLCDWEGWEDTVVELEAGAGASEAEGEEDLLSFPASEIEAKKTRFIHTKRRIGFRSDIRR